MSTFRRSPNALVPTFEHPLSEEWAGPGGAWTDETLDTALAGTTPFEDEIAEIAGGLAARGVRAGSTVSWQLANGWPAISMFRACWRLGAVAAPIHHLAGRADVDAMLDRLAPAAFVASETELPSGPRIRTPTSDVDAASVAVALGTSGSTGRPKVALHSHRALLHKARVMTSVHGLGPDDAILLPAPMAHLSGLLNGVLLAVSGLRVVPMAKWDPVRALEVIERDQVTFMIGPPAFFVSLVNAPGFSPDAVRSLRLISCGGSGVTPAFVESTSTALGCRVKRTYGSTEAPTVTTSTEHDSPTRAATTDGHPVGLVELRTVDGAGLDTAPGQPGELLVRGPELFVGYDDPVATAAAFAEGGWFRTGDLATLDEAGWLTIVGRIKDVIIRGGENIATMEIESVLEAHPDVREAVVVGVPDARLGERVCAFVVVDRPFTLADCREWFEQHEVTRFKWPERVEAIAELPLLGSGKPDKAALRARLAPA
ncbi:MAG: class I adenylate-forming enzyme family protein [Acidimicrobiales bacterium]